MKTGPYIATLALTSLLVIGGMARAGDVAANKNDWKPLPDRVAHVLTETVQRVWRAKTGETAAQMLERLSSIAHILPRRWIAWTSNDGTRTVGMTWARTAAESEDDSVPITWDVAPDGHILGTADRLFDLGSSAFAVATIQNDVNEGRPDANIKFLRDPANLNFVPTPHGDVGDLLVAAKCRLANPTYLDRVVPPFSTTGKAYVRMQATVNCAYNLSALAAVEDIYHYSGALIVFLLRDGETEWVPASFLAARIWNGLPGHWDKLNLPIEHEVLSAARGASETTELQGFTSSDLARVVELRNSGHSLSGNIVETRAFETLGLLVRMQTATDGRVTPRSVEVFLRHAGVMATIMSDDAIVQSAPMMNARP